MLDPDLVRSAVAQELRFDLHLIFKDHQHGAWRAISAPARSGRLTAAVERVSTEKLVFVLNRMVVLLRMADLIAARCTALAQTKTLLTNLGR